MKAKMKFYNCLFYAVFAIFMAIAWTSCSEDIADMYKPETTSITFDLGGGIKTRAQNNAIDFSKFEVKLYMFSATKGTTKGSLESYTYDQTRDVERSLITVDGIDMTKNYIYVFIAYEKAYATQAKVKVWDAGSFSSGELVLNTSLYTNSYIQVMDEAKYSKNLPVYSKSTDAEDDFMIYGAGIQMAALIDFYTPVSVVLTRQLGAVEFRGKVGTNASCSVFSEYYRLYLSQMVENGKDGRGTQNYPLDYSVMGLLPFMFKDFSDATSYVIYLPCTTTHSESELTNYPLEYANWERDPDYAGYTGDGQVETSITIDGTKYSTKEKFPIFPDRKTILTMDDGTHLRVSFSGTSGGVDLEEDWNGM